MKDKIEQYQRDSLEKDSYNMVIRKRRIIVDTPDPLEERR